ncbi:hypothetical protein [Thioalkalivibrio denitrificans]|uniref:hypothetical protein n=1 Tax=Thioalkalivibrio denitrificans TaxID=108003 RepID=UPI001C37A8BB|nr:hypothetical protein [Thioalkalivibrio denitrificans]
MIKADFTRISAKDHPAAQTMSPGWFAISHRWIAEKDIRRRSYGTWFKISRGRKYCYRTLTMVAFLEGSPNSGVGEICIDWGAWLYLDDYKEKTSPNLTLEIEPAGLLSMPHIALSHPDPGYRIASKIALISLGLGILSAVLAIGL